MRALCLILTAAVILLSIDIGWDVVTEIIRGYQYMSYMVRFLMLFAMLIIAMNIIFLAHFFFVIFRHCIDVAGDAF